MNTISQGLVLSGVGLLVAFTAMASFILIIIVLQILFPARPKREGGEAAVEEVPETAAQTVVSEEGPLVAAIAVALISAREKAGSSLGAALKSGRSAWWSANLMAARKETTHK